jgi:hypothetical protein
MIGNVKFQKVYLNTIEHEIATTSVHYKNMNSTSPRFPKEREATAPPPFHYNTDTGHKMTMGRQINQSPIKYHQCFRSSSPRFPSRPAGKDKELIAPLATLDYDINTGRTASLVTNVERSPTAYSNVRSHSPRFARDPPPPYVTSLGPGAYEVR